LMQPLGQTGVLPVATRHGVLAPPSV